MSADSPRRSTRGVPAIVPPQVVSDRSIIDSVAGFINDVTLAHQPQCDPKDTITWARFETAADISDSRFGDDWELEGNVAPPLLLILGYGQGVQVWAIPANGEAVEVLSWRHGIVSALRVLPTPCYVENGRADEPIDAYVDKRPLMAICDGTTPAGSNPQFCAVNFVSLKTGAQVKTIKFKNPVLDILANRSSIVITFHERIAVFDARSLEDRLSVTTCFPSPGINPNPVALGSRWMAYSENKLLHSKRSGGGCDGDGVSSYTATVLNAAKSFGKGLRELGEQVAAGLTGTTGSGMSSKSSSFDSATGDVRQPGVVTILDIKHPIKDVSPTSGTPVSINGSDPIVAHFIAHSESVVAMEFDNSGMMLLTADRRGHDFHLFRIQPHPVGSSLAAVHHLYVLHRGDTSAKVQNITFSLDSRWVAVSTLRGTTHVFPVTPYGGPAGVRTHTSLHVVNKLSRFHRSAGLTADGRSSSPISHSDSTNFCQILMPYHNPTLPPFPRPTVVLPLAQLRQPFALGSPPGSAVPSSYSKASNTRQRLSSLSDDNGKPLSVCAVFAKSRSWLLDPPNTAREAPHKIQRKAVDSLFVMAGHGALIQYDLDTKLATNVAKEKICDDTPIELEVEAKAQWNLGRKDGSLEIMAPLSSDNWLIKDRNSCMLIDSTRQFDDSDDRCDSWLSQVEIITHAGPHRRLWMGPQFVFKTYNTPSGSNLSHIDVEAVEIGVSPGPSTTCRPERSSPLNMPLSATGRSTVPVLIESGSYSSIEQSPKLMDRFRHEHMNSDFSVAHGDSRLKEDLADAMRESPSVSHKDTGDHPQRRRPSAAGSSRATASSSPSPSPKARSGGSGGVSSTSSSSSSTATLVDGGVASSSTSTTASVYSSQYESFESLMQQQQPQQQQHMKTTSIEKVVNPLGTVTTITGNCNSGLDIDDVMKGVSAQEYVIHENCDESLFRPVVAIFCDESNRLAAEQLPEDAEYTKPPEAISNKLIVPVIEKAVDLELTKKESLKHRGRRQQHQQIHLVKEVREESDDEVVKFNLADLNRKAKSIDKKLPVKEEIVKNVISKSLNNEAAIAIAEEEVVKKLPTSSKMNLTKDSEDEMLNKKFSDNDIKTKYSKDRKSVEIGKISNKDSVIDKKENTKSLVCERKDDSKSKLIKVRKRVDKETLSEEECVIEKRSDNLEKADNSGQSSIHELRIKKEEEEGTVKKILKRCKSEERDSDVIKIVLDTESKSRMEKQIEDDSTKTFLKIAKTDKVKECADDEVLKAALLKLVKPLKTNEFEGEQPIEFKRMTVVSPVRAASSSKTVNKSAIIEKTAPIKIEEKVKPKTIEKKIKLEKESSIESTESNEMRGISAKYSPYKGEKISKGRSKSPEKVKITDQVDGKPTATTPKKAKREPKKELSFEDVKTTGTSGTSLAVQLSNVCDLADSLLDFLPEKTEEDKSISVDIDKLKKKTDSEAVVLDIKVDKKSNLKVLKPLETKKSEITMIPLQTKKSEITMKQVSRVPDTALSKNELLKSLKKSKPDKTTTGLSKLTWAKVEEPTDLTVDKKNTIQSMPVENTVETKKSDIAVKEIFPVSDIALSKKESQKSLKKSKPEKITLDVEQPTDLTVAKKNAIQSMPADKIVETKKNDTTLKEMFPVPDVALSKKESQKKSKKSKPDKITIDISKLTEQFTDLTVNKTDTIITVEEKTGDETESVDIPKNLLKISTSVSETKTKLKKKPKAEKIAAETTQEALNLTEDILENNKPLHEAESMNLLEILSANAPSPSTSEYPSEKRVKKDKLSKLLELSAKTSKTEMSVETGKQVKKDTPSEMTGSKITIEPITIDTFLSDLMDSQQATKSKSSPTSTVKSEESHKKADGSPLKFVDTYVDTFPDVPLKKEKSTPGKAGKLYEKHAESAQMKSSDTIQFFEKFLQESAEASVQPVTPWKSLSKGEDKVKSLGIDYPTLGKPIKMKKSQSPPAEKINKPISLTIGLSDDEKKSLKKTTDMLNTLPGLQPLEDLPMDFLDPLPPLEPLEGDDENISLINFESPLQEASKPIKSEKEINKLSPQFPKGFPVDTIIFALCGSLHYENESSGKPVDSPLTLSYSDSTAQTAAEYKSLTENDDQYLSLEQSSQENAASTSSSTCEDITEAAYSSGGGEKVTIDSDLTKNKHRRQKQLITAAPDDDEELRPLISKHDVKEMACSLTECKANVLEKATTILKKKETLPQLDNNQVNSDSSSSDQATSEDPDDQICLNVHAGDAVAAAAATVNSTDNTDKSAEDEAGDMTSSVQQASQTLQQPNLSKKKPRRRKR